MKLKIKVVAASVVIRCGKGGVVRIEAGKRPRGRVGGKSAARVTPAMEAEAVRAFISRSDPVRLGAVLAEVYREMERVRAAGDGPYTSL